jgi:hypothetical protein
VTGDDVTKVIENVPVVRRLQLGVLLRAVAGVIKQFSPLRLIFIVFNVFNLQKNFTILLIKNLNKHII